MTAYEMCIANIAHAIRKSNTQEDGVRNAFDYAPGIAVGFCKNEEEVILDIVNFHSNKA